MMTISSVDLYSETFFMTHSEIYHIIYHGKNNQCYEVILIEFSDINYKHNFAIKNGNYENLL